MSRRDARKTLMLAVPEPMRVALLRTAPCQLPLAYLLRQGLRRALDAGLGWQQPVQPAGHRVVRLQLSAEEQARLALWDAARGVAPEVAVLSLVQRLLQEEGHL
jgi:hypothetical protein